jgi:hypothetical protein
MKISNERLQDYAAEYLKKHPPQPLPSLFVRVVAWTLFVVGSLTGVFVLFELIRHR